MPEVHGTGEGDAQGEGWDEPQPEPDLHGSTPSCPALPPPCLPPACLPPACHPAYPLPTPSLPCLPTPCLPLKPCDPEHQTLKPCGPELQTPKPCGHEPALPPPCLPAPPPTGGNPVALGQASGPPQQVTLLDLLRLLRQRRRVDPLAQQFVQEQLKAASVVVTQVRRVVA